MSILTALRKIFHVLLNLWLRVLCWKKRHRDDSDSILPLHVNQKKFNVESNYSPSNYSAYPATINSGHSFYRGATTVNNSHATHPQQLSSHNAQPSQDQEDEDFFKDMEPSLNEQRKYFIADSNQGASNFRRETYNKLSVDLSSSFEMNPELENLEDDVAVTSWEDEAATGELEDIDQTLSAARAQERMRRLEEHRRQRMEREMRKAQNLSSKSRSLGSRLG